MFSVDGGGNVPSVLALGSALARRGAAVTVAAQPSLRETVSDMGAFVALRGIDDWVSGVPLEEQRELSLDLFAGSDVGGQIAELSVRSDAVIVDAMLSTALAAAQRAVEALKVTGIDGLVTTGAHVDPTNLTDSDWITITDYVPHGQILPNVDVVVTHAGLGTVMAALSHGVPLVCIPQGREQPANARRAEELGAGITLDRDASSEQIADAVQDVVGQSAYRQAAADLRQAINQAGGLRTATELIEELLDHAPN